MRLAVLAVLAALAATPAASPTSLTPSSDLPSNVGFNDTPLDWSPDGRIAFLHARHPPESSVWAPVFEIRVMTADGGGKRLLAPKVRRDTEEWDSSVHWSPDGALATFVRMLGTEVSMLHVVRADGTGLRPLTDTAANDGEGVWSPDGQTVAFARFSFTPSPSPGIWLVRPDGTGLRQLTRGDDYGPVWSPDNRTIAFNRRIPSGKAAIFTVGVEGGALRQLIPFADLRVTQWSADGALLMYETGRDSAQAAMRTMRPDGGDRRKLVDGISGVWSPDGTRLIFARTTSTRRGPLEHLFVSDASGRNARLLFRGARQGIWSRDGARVAVPSFGPCNGWGVYVVRISTKRARRISNDCRVIGTERADRLRGTRERDLIWGRGGNDVIDASPGNPKVLWAPRLDHNVVDGGAGNDRIIGRRGQDTLIGGPGRDDVRSAGQDDRILVRDGEVDVVRCGWGNADTVLADRFDVVAPDCERVLRG